MSDLVPASPSLLAPLTDASGGGVLTRLQTFAGQRGVRRMLPWFITLAAIGGMALAWQELAPAPQRMLFAQLDDN